MPKLIRPRYEQGLAAYRAGHGILHVMEIGDEIENFSRAAESDPGPMYSHDAMPSVIAGFADGLIEDIRRITGTGRRAGLTA